jgi:hypothetical protein
MNIARRLRALAAFSALLLAACTSAREGATGAARTRGGDGARGGAVAIEPTTPPSSSAGASSSTRLAFDSDRGQAEKLALLVGIDEYAPGTPANFKKLAGCVRDTELVRTVLEDRFEFPREDILVLTNAEATHENIVRAFREWLIARAGKDTEVLFWFSGHGSRIPDLSGSKLAERGGKESTFVAYDSRAGGADGAFDVSDDEMRSLLYALTRITSRVTVVTDSCHSGGATRGVQRVRAADEGSKPLDFERLRSTFWPADVPLRDDDGANEVEADRYVHISACSDTQLAQEIDTEDAQGTVQSHGALTFFLTQCLQNAQPKASYRSLADEAAVRLSTQIPGQTVWSEGALDRELFGARFRARPAGFRARALSTEEIQIDAGSMLGLRVDSRVAIYDGGSDLRIGTASLVRVGAQSSVARWESPPSSAPDGALRAVEESRPFGQSPLAVHFESARTASWFQGSERVIAQIGDARRCDLLLAPDREGDGVALFTPEGLRLWQHAAPAEADRETFVGELEAQLREELRYRALFALANDTGTLRVSARFEPPTAAELAQFAEAGRYAHVHDAEPRLEAGARASEYHAIGALSADLRLAVLVVENTSPRDAYISVLSVSEDRGRNLIWPLGGQQDKVLPAGETQRISVNVTAHTDWNLARPMRDRYLVIATSEAADFQPMTRVATLRSGAADTASGARMPEMLSLALEKPPTRGVKLAKVDGKGWGVVCVDLLVSRPDAP